SHLTSSTYVNSHPTHFSHSIADLSTSSLRFPYTTLFRSFTDLDRRRRELVEQRLRDAEEGRARQEQATQIAESLVKEHTFGRDIDRKSTRLNSSHVKISYGVFCVKKKKKLVVNINYNQRY